MYCYSLVINNDKQRLQQAYNNNLQKPKKKSRNRNVGKNASKTKIWEQSLVKYSTCQCHCHFIKSSHPCRLKLLFRPNFNRRLRLQLAVCVLNPFGLLFKTGIVVTQELISCFATTKSGEKTIKWDVGISLNIPVLFFWKINTMFWIITNN